MVTIKFNSSLKRYNNNKDTAALSLNKEVRVRDILNMFNIIPGEVGIILLNSKLASEEATAEDQDRIELFPIVGGG